MKNNEFLDYIDRVMADKQPIIARILSVDKNVSKTHNELVMIDDFTGYYNWYDYNINDETDTIVAYIPLNAVPVAICVPYEFELQKGDQND